PVRACSAATTPDIPGTPVTRTPCAPPRTGTATPARRARAPPEAAAWRRACARHPHCAPVASHARGPRPSGAWLPRPARKPGQPRPSGTARRAGELDERVDVAHHEAVVGLREDQHQVLLESGV